MAVPQGRGISLAAATYGFVLVTVVVVGLVGSLVFYSRADGLLDGALDEVVRVRTQAAGTDLARSLEADWQALGYLAGTVAGLAPTTLRGIMDAIRRDGSRVSWIGHADTAGRVLAASGGLLEGADVSERPWFRAALRGDYAGDVHEAVLLASLLQGPDGAPPRFIDLARPVRSPDGEVIGVVGMHIDATWLRDYLAETGRMLEIDLYLISQDGSVVAAPDEAPPSRLELAMLGAARTGQASAGREVWPDGGTYFTSVLPSVGYGDLPSFGWRLAGRIGSTTFSPTFSAALANIAITIGLSLLVLAAVTSAYMIVFIRPLSRLADGALGLARGAVDYPAESASTREAAQLTEALSRLQAERINRPRT